MRYRVERAELAMAEEADMVRGRVRRSCAVVSGGEAGERGDEDEEGEDEEEGGEERGE